MICSILILKCKSSKLCYCIMTCPAPVIHSIFFMPENIPSLSFASNLCSGIIQFQFINYSLLRGRNLKICFQHKSPLKPKDLSEMAHLARFM